LKLFPVSVVGVGHLAGHASIVAARYVQQLLLFQ